MRAWVCVVVLLLGGEGFPEGAQAYREGRYQDALQAFRAAERRWGHEAPPALCFDRALAALRAGELVEAAYSAEKAAVRGGTRFTALRDFVLGSVAFARATRSRALARRPEGGLPELDAAMGHAEAAREHWQRAATSRSDWPEARRNVERALLLLDELEREREAAEARRTSRPRPSRPEAGEDRPSPGDPAGGGTDPELAPRGEPQWRELAPEQVRGLLERLRRKEAEKLELRRARRAARSGGPDW